MKGTWQTKTWRGVKRIVRGVVLMGVVTFIIGLVGAVMGARINTSKSIPLGLYWASSLPVRQGAYVLVCPPQIGVFAQARERDYIGVGFCAGGYGYLMKQVAALKNDEVTIDALGVHVNGVLRDLSALRTADKAGRLLPRYQSNHYTLGDSQVLLMSDGSSTSFDGRYFGPIDRAQIKAVIVPVITWRTEPKS